MLELQQRFMTTAELAEWAGISVSGLEKHKKSWCEKNLHKYAEYELKRGGVVIKNIYEPIYLGSGFKEVQNKYEEYYGHDDVKADTARNCWNKLEPHMNNKIADTTGVSYVGKARIQDYGTARKNKKRAGIKGDCHFVFGKIVKGEFYPFTDEEIAIKKDLSKKYFNNLKMEAIEDQQALNWALKHKEITVEEYAIQMQEILDKDVNWIDFQLALEKAIGAKTDFRIQLERCAWDNSNKNFEF